METIALPAPAKTGTEQENKPEDRRMANWWKKGQSGNPKGRPKGRKDLTTLMREYLISRSAVIKDEDGNDLEVNGMAALADAIYRKAVESGSVEAQKMIWEFLDGKPAQTHDINLNGPKGYEISPEKEAMYQKQFDAVIDAEVIEAPRMPLEAPENVEVVSSIEKTPESVATGQESANPATLEPHATQQNA